MSDLPPDEERCIQIKTDGQRCTRDKEEGREYCWQHPRGKNINKTGHNLPQKKIEKIKADSQVYTSVNYIANRNNVSWETVKRIQEEYEDEIEKYRDEKKKEFADRAWESIQDALKIGDKKLKLTLEHSEDLEGVINKLLGLCKSGAVEFNQVKPLIKTLSSLADYSLRDISTFIGTLVDKHELITGEPTERTQEVESKLEDYFE